MPWHTISSQKPKRADLNMVTLREWTERDLMVPEAPFAPWHELKTYIKKWRDNIIWLVVSSILALQDGPRVSYGVRRWISVTHLASHQPSVEDVRCPESGVTGSWHCLLWVLRTKNSALNYQTISSPTIQDFSLLCYYKNFIKLLPCRNTLFGVIWI